MTELNEQQPTGEEVSDEMIRRRAYKISREQGAGTPEENWRRAERELRGEPGSDASLRNLEVELDDLRKRCAQPEHALQWRS